MIKIHQFNTVAEFVEHAAEWNELWWRSDSTLPTARAELIAQWVEHFAPRSRFQALVVEEDGRWVAALPLVAQRLRGVLSVGALTGDEWSPAGDLLLDSEAASAAALGKLLAALRRGPWQWLWIPLAATSAPRWRSLLAACANDRVAAMVRDRFPVACIDIADDWETFAAQLSRSHRQRMNKASRRLEQAGQVEFIARSHFEPHEIEAWLREGFTVEDLSWKGEAGSSVLHTPGMFDYFHRQAAQLAQWGHLEMAMLRLDGRPLAFLYGYRAKGVYYAYKIGYDPQYSAHSPGQLLIYHLLRHLHEDGDCRTVDCMGPLSETTVRWRPRRYTAGRVIVAPGRWPGRLALWAYRRMRPARPAPTAADGEGDSADSEATPADVRAASLVR